MAWIVETRAMCRWKRLNVENRQPVAQRNALFRMPNAQMKGRLEMQRVPVRVAKCLKIGGDAATVLHVPGTRN